MSDGGAPSRYVKLTKEQAPVDEVNPGELNQPIQVPQVCLSLFLSTDLILHLRISRGLSHDHVYFFLVFNCLRSRM